VERDGVKVFYEVFGDGDHTLLLMPTWPIVHSGLWKGQVAYLARHFRVVTYDPRGNGRSDRPPSSDAYTEDEYLADAVAVMDATGTSSAVVAGLCSSGRKAIELASAHPDRVEGLILLAPAMPFTPEHPWVEAADAEFEEELESYEGW